MLVVFVPLSVRPPPATAASAARRAARQPTRRGRYSRRVGLRRARGRQACAGSHRWVHCGALDRGDRRARGSAAERLGREDLDRDLRPLGAVYTVASRPGLRPTIAGAQRALLAVDVEVGVASRPRGCRAGRSSRRRPAPTVTTVPGAMLPSERRGRLADLGVCRAAAATGGCGPPACPAPPWPRGSRRSRAGHPRAGPPRSSSRSPCGPRPRGGPARSSSRS